MNLLRKFFWGGAGPGFARTPCPTVIRIIVFMLLVAGQLSQSACDKSKLESQGGGASGSYTSAELLTALRSVSLRTRLKLPDLADVGAIGDAADADEAFAAYSEAVERYVQSAEFAGAIRIFFRQMFGMGGDDIDDPDENSPADLATFVVTHDKPYSELLTANYKVSSDIPIIGQDSDSPSLENLGGFATLRSWLRHWYGNGHGFHYLREIAMLVKCYRYPDPEEVGKWPEEEIHPKYRNHEDSEVGINCYSCHGTMNARRAIFLPYGQDGVYSSGRNSEWLTDRRMPDAEQVEFDGETIAESVSGGAKPRYTQDFENDPNGFPMVGDYMRQIVEADQFKSCTARRFLAFALGYEAAGAPGQDPVVPFDFAGSSKTGDEELLTTWTERLSTTHGLVIRDFLVDFMTHEDFISRAGRSGL